MAETNNNVLEIIELGKVFRDFWGRERVQALSRLNLDVKRGEVFGLLGPNGSGKTTTVRIVLGLLFPTSGAVRLFGKSPRNVDVKSRIGYMPEESHLYGYLNAEETLDFFGRLFGLSREERRRRADALIEMVGLKRARRRPLGEYSKGMARRIGLAQSLINDPDFLILDEPTTGLDPIGAREMKDLILTLKERGKTIFLCSHLLADVEDVCDRVCILYGGKQRAEGKVEDLLKAKDSTQIRAPRLQEETVEQIKAVIGRALGAGVEVEVSSPTRRLEDFFLEVVAEARRERLATSGAEMGAGTAQFLEDEGAKAEKLVEELVGAARQAELSAEAGQSEAESVPAMTPAAGRGVIDNLVKQTPEEPDRQGRSEPEDAVLPETGLRRDLLDKLMADSQQQEDTDEDDQ